MTEKGFRKLVEEHYERLFRAARFMCADQQAAEDLVHETFLAAAESFGRFQGRSSTYTWLYGIMLNKLRRWLRRRSSAAVSLQQFGGSDQESLEDVLEADAPQPAEEVERAEAIEQVRQAMDELSPDHRTVIALRYVDGLSYQQIAELLGCPLGTVKSRIHYALERIAQKLKHDQSLPG